MARADAHYVCRGWRESARAGRARVAPSGRLALVTGGKATLPSHCPWCGDRFYTAVAGEQVMTIAGRVHRELSREAGA